MSCFLPKAAVYKDRPNDNGNFELTFSKDSVETADRDSVILVPCGECIGCKLERARQWAMRGMHESQEYDHNCFLTLTYADENLPANNSLRKNDLTLFWKRLRKAISPGRIRYFASGEYGDPRKGERAWNPHYHAVVFGLNLDDEAVWYGIKKGRSRWTSPTIGKCWKYGDHQLEKEVNFANVAYVAGYTMKQLVREDMDYGEREKEFCCMSRGGRRRGAFGIGAKWFQQYGKECYMHDSIVVNGREVRPPRYYDALLSGVDPERFEELKEERLQAAKDDPNRAFDKRMIRMKIAMKAQERKVLEL